MGENLNTAEIEKYILTEQTMKKGILLVAPQVFERAKIFYLLYFIYKTSNKNFEIINIY